MDLLLEPYKVRGIGIIGQEKKFNVAVTIGQLRSTVHTAASGSKCLHDSYHY